MATELMPVMMQERNRIYPAIGLALVVEILLVAGASSLLSHRVQPSVVPRVTVVTLSLAPAPTPPAPKPEPLPHPPQPEPPKPHVTPARTIAHALIHRATTPPVTPAPVVPAPVAQKAPDFPATPPVQAIQPVQPVQAPAPERVAAPSAPDKTFEGALRAAIQAALHYPESARMAGMSGRARVAFDYRDGAVSNARVVVSSGTGLLDRAALAAVESATLPKPAAEWAGKTLSEQIWVTFDLDDRS